MSTESEESVQSDCQPEALLERVLVLEQSLNTQGPRSQAPELPDRAVRDLHTILEHSQPQWQQR